MITYIVLSIVIGALLVERYMWTKEMNRQTADLSKLLASKTPEDYITYKAPERVHLEQKPAEQEEVELSELTDKEFLQVINK